jgi:hypothetical protein
VVFVPQGANREDTARPGKTQPKNDHKRLAALSAISYQLSAISYQLSAVSYQLVMRRRQETPLPMAATNY